MTRSPLAISLVALVLGSLLGPLNARAEMSSITAAAKVLSVGDANVKVRIDGKDLVLPKDLVSESDVKEGDAILITFRREQIRYLLKSGDVRQPASVSGSSRKKR